MFSSSEVELLHGCLRQVRTALSNLRSDPQLPEAPLQGYLKETGRYRKTYRKPEQEHDRLFSTFMPHNPKYATCDSCSKNHIIQRPIRTHHHLQIHYGLVASGNQVMKYAKLRDKWNQERDVLCSQMEAARFMKTQPCLVIRGIRDYSASHKNEEWQEYEAQDDALKGDGGLMRMFLRAMNWMLQY